MSANYKLVTNFKNKNLKFKISMCLGDRKEAEEILQKRGRVGLKRRRVAFPEGTWPKMYQPNLKCGRGGEL